MIVLTPAERRAALLLVLLLALGALWDLFAGRTSAPVERDVPGERGADADAGNTPLAPDAVHETHDAPPAALVDINHATARELDALPGVGPVLAARILEHRRQFGSFRTAEDLRAVRGIGPRLYARLRPLIALGAVDSLELRRTRMNAVRPAAPPGDSER